MTNDQQQATTAIVTTPTDREIHIERVFDAPRDQVFAAYTDPELIPQWWGPRDTTTLVDRMDVRTGGDWRFVMRSPDGSETGFRGTYREVTPPERIVQTFEWEGMPGHVSVETATFEDLGDRTKVTTTSIFHTAEE
ncbi:MAG: SRPBCC family protein, partial [Thermoleophilaceae bacterium]